MHLMTGNRQIVFDYAARLYGIGLGCALCRVTVFDGGVAALFAHALRQALIQAMLSMDALHPLFKMSCYNSLPGKKKLKTFL